MFIYNYAPQFCTRHRKSPPYPRPVAKETLIGHHFQSEVKCKTFVVEMSFIYMRIKTHFNIIGFALSVALKQRLGATKQWPLFDTTD